METIIAVESVFEKAFSNTAVDKLSPIPSVQDKMYWLRMKWGVREIPVPVISGYRLEHRFEVLNPGAEIYQVDGALYRRRGLWEVEPLPRNYSTREIFGTDLTFAQVQADDNKYHFWSHVGPDLAGQDILNERVCWDEIDDLIEEDFRIRQTKGLTPSHLGSSARILRAQLNHSVSF